MTLVGPQDIRFNRQSADRRLVLHPELPSSRSCRPRRVGLPSRRRSPTRRRRRPGRWRIEAVGRHRSLIPGLGTAAAPGRRQSDTRRTRRRFVRIYQPLTLHLHSEAVGGRSGKGRTAVARRAPQGRGHEPSQACRASSGARFPSLRPQCQLPSPPTPGKALGLEGFDPAGPAALSQVPPCGPLNPISPFRSTPRHPHNRLVTITASLCRSRSD
jgi:hypothetical protein